MFDSTPLLVPIFKRTHLVAYALISPEDRHVLDHAWTLHKAGYAQASTRMPEMLMHRFIAQPKDGLVVDHINGNRLDNRRENLRNCTYSENSRNTRRISNQSGVRGVMFDTRDKKWAAAIGYQNRRVHLGRFESLEEAGEIYDSAARQLHGEFAVLNYPDVNKHSEIDWVADAISRFAGSKRTKRITYQRAAEMRTRHAAGETQRELAEAYEVSVASICNIVNEKTHRSEDVLPRLAEALTEVEKGRAIHLVAKELHIATHTLKEAVKAKWGSTPPTTVYKRREGAKLSLQDVQDILKRVEAGEMQKTLAAEYGVTAATINGYVKHRRR